MDLIKKSVNSLKGHFVKALLLMLLPVSLTAILMFLGPISEYFSLIFMPFIVPFYYNAFKFVWDVANENYSDETKYLSYGTYMKNLGVRGCFGLLPPILYSLLFFSAFLTLFSSTSFFPFVRIFSGDDFANQLTEQLNLYYSTNDLTGLIEFLSNNGEQMTGAFTAIVNLSLFIALIIFVFIFNKPRLNYVLIQKVLPDANINIIGAQSRQMGRALLSQYFSKYLSRTFLPNLLLWGLNFIVLIGASIGFCFIKNPVFYFTASIPGVIFTFLSTPLLVINGSMDVALADEFVPIIYNKLSEAEKNMFVASFYSPNYKHSKENENKTPFNNLVTKINVNEDDVFDVESNEEQTDGDSHSDVGVNESKETKVNEDKSTYGVFDFSNNTDDENKDNEK